MCVSGDTVYPGMPEVGQIDRASALTKHREKRKVGKKGEKGSKDAADSMDGLASKKHHDSLSERRSSPNTPRYGSKIR